MSDLREALEKHLAVIEEGIARSTKPDREGFLMTSHVRQILAAAEVDPETGFARPLLDREAVRDAIRDEFLWAGPAIIEQDVESAVGHVMELARPMPTREQIDQALAGKPIVRSADKPSDWRGGLSPNEINDIATILLALLNGAE